ncbi:uncharacterized protein LOC136095279 [Hydra vulgaris]|uniref:uncharacterized protein LOC136095279 n=1 Tax=Hydra vulgaris TaxID=6087 RepID=UPI0032EA5459
MEQNKYFYENCCCFSKGNCGSFKKHKIINKMFYIHQLGDVDVKKHLINLKVMRLNDNNIWEENGLIANRLKRNLEKDEQICAFHRYTFGIAWSPPKTCFHPHHLNIIGKKSPALRASPIHVVISMSKRYNEVFSVGAMLCFTHLKQEFALSIVNENTNLCTETQTQQEQTYMTPATPDEEFDPGEINVSPEILDDSLRSLESVTEVLNASPIKFRLKRKFEYLEDTTKDKLKRKYVRLENLLKKKFAEAVAPGQEEILIDFLNSKNVDEINSPLPIEIIRAQKVYKQSDSMGKLVILSLIDHTKYTKKFIMNTFECTKHRIETARKWHASHKGLAFPEKKVFVRSNLDQTKCEHFLDFIFTNGILHDVAYGITKLKYDSGEEQKIVHAILTTKYSHAIMFYRKSCSENNYIPLSDSSLWNVLHAIKPLTSLDKVRNSFVHKMKITSQLNMPISSSSNSASVKDKPHCMNIFLLQGRALPVRSSFRFSNQQKELLYKYFIRGEESGNKMSPEQVHMQLRRELPPDQYVTSQQIRSLFSRFSNLKRKGKLVEPTTENNENSQVNDNKEVYGENDDFNLTGDNEDDNKYEEDTANLAKDKFILYGK